MKKQLFLSFSLLMCAPLFSADLSKEDKFVNQIKINVLSLQVGDFVSQLVEEKERDLNIQKSIISPTHHELKMRTKVKELIKENQDLFSTEYQKKKAENILVELVFNCYYKATKK